MANSYDVGEEQWIMERPSVAEMKRQYEEMVTRLISGLNVIPIRSTNREKILYLRRKRLQGIYRYFFINIIIIYFHVLVFLYFT